MSPVCTKNAQSRSSANFFAFLIHTRSRSEASLISLSPMCMIVNGPDLEAGHGRSPKSYVLPAPSKRM